MTVKLIAVDMDGTFLRDDKTYHRERFLKQYAEMKARGIRFVVASGNQYYQLTSFFPDIADDIAFVAENGAWVVCEGEDVFNGELSDDEYRYVIDHLMTLDDLEIIACGKTAATRLSATMSASKTWRRATITAWILSTTCTTRGTFSLNSRSTCRISSC